MLILFNLFLRCISLSANLLTSNTRHPTKNAVDEGRAGYLCKEKNSNGLVTMMKETIENKEQYDRTRKAAYQFSKDYLDLNISKLFEEFLNEMY